MLPRTNATSTEPTMPMPKHLPTVLFLLALGITRVAHAQESACGCDDVKDMRNRLCEAQAAVSEYGRHISKIREQERQTKKTVMLTEANYKDLVQPCVQEAINRVTDAGAKTASAETDNACNTTFKGKPTACMKELLTSHENVHVTACQKVKVDNDGFFRELYGLFHSFRDNQSLIDMLNEERAAYSVEIARIREQFDRLIRTSSCPGLPARRPGPERIYTIKGCPPPKPKPSQDDSICRVP
jgi:hypothetical protein